MSNVRSLRSRHVATTFVKMEKRIEPIQADADRVPRRNVSALRQVSRKEPVHRIVSKSPRRSAATVSVKEGKHILRVHRQFPAGKTTCFVRMIVCPNPKQHVVTVFATVVSQHSVAIQYQVRISVKDMSSVPKTAANKLVSSALPTSKKM